MNIQALFDKIAVDLEPLGATRDDAASENVMALAYEGRDFARLHGESMAFLLPTGSPALGDALALTTSRPAGDGWVEVDAADVGEWPHLAQAALVGLRS